MTRHDSSKRTFENLAAKLDKLCAGEAADEVIDDVFVDSLVEWLGPSEPLSDEAMHYAVTQLQAVMKDDALVASIRRDHVGESEEKTLGQVLHEVREKANWDLATVAHNLGSDTALVERLERDLVPLVQLTIQQWADVLEVFRLRVAEFARLAHRTCLAQALLRNAGPVYARSKTDPRSAKHGRELAFALARVLPDIAKRPSQATAIDPKLLEGVTAELRDRQRLDLISG